MGAPKESAIIWATSRTGTGSIGSDDVFCPNEKRAKWSRKNLNLRLIEA
jgi:hypothetical protein